MADDKRKFPSLEERKRKDEEKRMANIKERKRQFDVMREDRSYGGSGAKRPTPPVLKTKAASTLKTVADEPRGIVQRNTSKGSGSMEQKPYFNRLIDKAMAKYKKTDKTGISGRSVSKEKGLFTRTVDGRNEGVYEKTKTVKRSDGTVKKTVTKGKGVEGSVIGKYKDVKRFR